MSSRKSVWYRLGYAFEQARTAPARGTRKVASLKERATPSLPSRPSLPDLDDLLAGGAVALATKALDRWRPRAGGGVVSLLKAGAAGAAAALLVEVVRPLLSGEGRMGRLDEDTPDHLLNGAVQGLIYGTVVEGWIPGPPVVKGAVYGSAEYATHGLGGLTRLLGGRTPAAKLPLVGNLVKEMDPADRAYLESVVFGVALALLYGSDASSGMTGEEE